MYNVGLLKNVEVVGGEAAPDFAAVVAYDRCFNDPAKFRRFDYLSRLGPRSALGTLSPPAWVHAEWRTGD